MLYFHNLIKSTNICLLLYSLSNVYINLVILFDFFRTFECTQIIRLWPHLKEFRIKDKSIDPIGGMCTSVASWDYFRPKKPLYLVYRLMFLFKRINLTSSQLNTDEYIMQPCITMRGNQTVCFRERGLGNGVHGPRCPTLQAVLKTQWFKSVELEYACKINNISNIK